MKKHFIVLCVFINTLAAAQNGTDSLRLLQQAASLFDLRFTEAEADSLQGNILFYKSIYQRMHRELPANDLAFPFAFNPAPYGFVLPAKQEKIVWEISKPFRCQSIKTTWPSTAFLNWHPYLSIEKLPRLN